jgi:hypothetical protein
MICCYMPVSVEAHPVMIADQSAKKWNHHYHPQSNQPTVADGAAHSYGPRVSAERAARAMNINCGCDGCRPVYCGRSKKDGYMDL